MRIAFDVQPLLSKQKTGVGYYGDRLLRMILEKYPKETYSLLYFEKDKAKMKALLTDYETPSSATTPCRWFSGRFYRLLWGAIPIPFALFFGKRNQVTHFFNFLVPPGVAGKKVVSVHDMGYMAYPETVRPRTKYMLRMNLKRSCQRADKIITISEFSKSEIIKYLGIPSEKIEVVLIGVDHNTFHQGYSAESLKQVSNKYSVPEKYFLYLGTLEPRKNIKRLIEAYGIMIEQCPDAPPLVLAGGHGWLYDDLEEYVSGLGLSERCIFTGYIDGKDIPVLIQGAFLFAFPSLYEGFGIPPLEAMACGTPVLTSNASSLPEVVGDCAVLVDPISVKEISDGLCMLYSNEELRNSLVKKGLERAQNFTWERTASQTMDIYKALL